MGAIEIHYVYTPHQKTESTKLSLLYCGWLGLCVARSSFRCYVVRSFSLFSFPARQTEKEGEGTQVGKVGERERERIEQQKTNQENSLRLFFLTTWICNNSPLPPLPPPSACVRI
jgi:hypothetical protein